eukprot:TRINITY_DN7870_c0_g1_i1.p1 TRINITY_DN7870_c0_g1~~TRINITY_DN7870_c0_g1_i1.p1  ORF type:complete len:130 (+),score=22.27 TRINITY_DN7870_c0_g1_i1:29-391(+)
MPPKTRSSSSLSSKTTIVKKKSTPKKTTKPSWDFLEEVVKRIPRLDENAMGKESEIKKVQTPVKRVKRKIQYAPKMTKEEMEYEDWLHFEAGGGMRAPWAYCGYKGPTPPMGSISGRREY